MTYGPPGSQNWQQPPPGYGPQPGYGYGPPSPPPLPGIVKFLGIAALVWGLLAAALGIPGDGGSVATFAVKVLEGLLALVGGIMVLNRKRAGTTVITISGALLVLANVVALMAPAVLYDPALDFFEFGHDWYRYLHTLLGVVLLVWSLLPPVARALATGYGPPQPFPPGYGPPPQPPPGYGPPQQPPTWR